MNSFQRKDLYGVCLLLWVVSVVGTPFAVAQTTQQAQVIQSVRNDKLTTLRGNVHPMARAANDRGALPLTQPITRMTLLLQRSAGQETALQQLLSEQQDPKSPNYHAWLTPHQFGQQFGPAESDLQTLKSWLSSQGFSNLQVNNGKTLITFDGTAGQVRNAFHTDIHRLSVNGKEHFANMQDPQIPDALAPVVAGVTGLHNFHPKPLVKRFGKFQRNMKTGEITPLFTFTDVNGTFFGVGPADFKTIYNVPSTLDGSGVSIAIVAQSNINIQDVRDFRTIFGLSANDPQVILNGPDPGLVSGDEGESALDVEWAGAIAPKASIKLVVTKLSNTSGASGVDASAQYIVDNNVAPILSESYGACESALGTAGNQFYQLLWQQAAAQGITVVVSAGDNGSAGCDDPNKASSTKQGIDVSGLASTPYNLAMGGTDFDQGGNSSRFWNAANGIGQVSAKGYIPETVWNDSCAFAGLGGCTNVTAANPPQCPSCVVAGSGGPSSVYSKPPWQSSAITGMPSDGHRDTPDISLFAGDGLNASFYITCQSDQDIPGDTGCNLTKFSSSDPFHDFQAVGGTSAGAPAFAGIMALVVQKTAQRQGVAAFKLYQLAQSESFAQCNSSSGTSGSPTSSCIFNDITVGNNSVPCAGASTNCSKTTSGGFGILAFSGAPAFNATVGFDLATGLGSLNVANLLNAWNAKIATATTVTVSSSTINSGASLTITAKVDSPSNSSQGPTGTIQFQSGSTSLGGPVTCVPAGATPSAGASCTATLTTTLALLPPGFFVEPRPRNIPFVIVALVATVVAFMSFLLAARSASRRLSCAYAAAAFTMIAAITLAGCGGGAGSGGGGSSSRSITAAYGGDTNYASSSGSTSVTVH